MKSISKFALAASIGLALTFTLSCSGDDGDGDGGSSSSGGTQGGVSSSSGGGEQGGGSSSSVGGGGSSSSSQCSNTDSGIFTDDRDGQTYRYVTLAVVALMPFDERDGQILYRDVTICSTWMAENLNFEVEGSKCYDEDPDNCTKYGQLYDWATAMNNSASSNTNPSEVRGICPTSWHLPSRTEWDILVTHAGGRETAGTKLKATSGWDNGNGTDEYGFSALPGGSYESSYSSGSYFSGVGNSGYWWSASERDSNEAYGRGIEQGSENEARNYTLGKSSLFSVRCVKD